MDSDWLIEISNIFFPEIMHIYLIEFICYMVELSTPILSVCGNWKNIKRKQKWPLLMWGTKFDIHVYVKMFLKIESSHETNPPPYERKVTLNVTWMIMYKKNCLCLQKLNGLHCSAVELDPIEKCIKSFLESTCTNLHWT